MIHFNRRARLSIAACALLPTLCIAQGIPTAAAGQAASSPSIRSWVRTYGSHSPHEGVFDMRFEPNGGIRVAGYGSSPGTSNAAGLLMRMSPGNGELNSQSLLRNQTIPGFGSPVDGAGLAADGGALFTGRIVDDLYMKHDGWVARVDREGNPLWQRGFTVPGFGRFSILDVVELSSGAWIIAGATSVDDQPPQAAYIVRLSASGAVDWQYEYLAGVSEHVQSITATSDGGFAIVGWTVSSGAGCEDVWFMKLDAAGTVQWQRTYGGSDCDQGNSIIELSGGGYAIAARTTGWTQSGNAPWILVLDAQGNLLWQRVVDGVWGDLSAIAETAGGGVVALGRVGEAGFPSNDLWAVELDSAGGLRWQRAYEGESGDWGSSIVVMPDSSFLFGGTWGWGFPEGDVFLVRTAPGGSLAGCGLDRTTTFPLISPLVSSQPSFANRAQGVAINRVYSFTALDGDVTSALRCR